MEFDKKLIDNHEQKNSYSCIPSGVEMVLKLKNVVLPDFYGLQIDWKNKKHGSFACFDNFSCNGITFKFEFGFDRDDNFPIDNLFNRINSELQNERYVCVSLESNGGWHVWVIHEISNNEYLAFSKSNCETIIITDVKQIIRRMKGTDILTYVTI